MDFSFDSIVPKLNARTIFHLDIRRCFTKRKHMEYLLIWYLISARIPRALFFILRLYTLHSTPCTSTILKILFLCTLYI